MTHFVNDKCANCKHTNCVEVCPTDCFHEGKNMLVINPENCIDCGICVAECPVDAIVHYTGQNNDDATLHWLNFNRDMVAQHAWPLLTQVKPAMPNAEEAAKIADKRHLISEEPGEGD